MVVKSSGAALNKQVNISSLGLTVKGLDAYASSAYERGNVVLFSILKGYISAEKRKKYLEEAISCGNVAMASILISSLRVSDDDEE